MSDLEQAPSGQTVFPLGKYLVLAELGRGGMAEVFLALARGPNGFNKLFVLKLLRPHLAEDAEFVDMFLVEARLAARLNHPNVVQTYEVAQEGGRACIVMEYLEGRSLAEVEHAVPPLSLNLAVRVLADTLAGLHHAHNLTDIDGTPSEVVHRDVSPQNIFVTYDGQVKVLDFGIAKAANTGSQTKTGVFKGKIRYTAPERVAGTDSDRRSDIFSVGVLLWQAATGKRLWSGMNDLAIMHQLANRTAIPSVRALNPAVPERLAAICAKALAYEPRDRYQTAAEFQDALEDYLSEDSVATTNRALGKFMVDSFAEKRAQFQRAVDEQMRAAATVPLDPTASLSRIRAEAILPALGSTMPSSSSSLRSLTGVRSSVQPVSGGILGIEPSSVAPMPPSFAPQPTSRKGYVLALAAVLVSAAVSVAIQRRSDAPPAPPPAMAIPAAEPIPAPASAPPPPAPAAAAPSATVEPEAAPSASVEAVHKAPPPSVPVPSFGAARPAASSAKKHGAPAPEPPRAAPSAKPEAPKREVDCSSPYYVDEQGVKKIRSECL